MNLDEQLESIEKTGETEAEFIDEEISKGHHEEIGEDLEEVIEMEIEDGDIYAYLVDEDDNEIGFVLLDEDGNEQEYYYVDMSEYEFTDEGDAAGSGNDERENAPVARAENSDRFDIGFSREAIAEATDDMNAIYKEGSAVASELKEALGDINQTFGGFKRKR